MGVYFDLGRPVIGGWMGGGWVTHDPLREVDLLWGAEFGQEGAVLFAIDVDTGEVVERHRIGAREFSAIPREETGELWIYTYHGINQPGNLLLSWDPQTRRLASHGFPPLPGQRFVGAAWGRDGRLYLGTHPHGHLASFDPETETWRDYGCQAPPPLIPGQQIWCRPVEVNEAGEILCAIVRERPGQMIALDPATGTTRLLAEIPRERPALRGTLDFDAGTYAVTDRPEGTAGRQHAGRFQYQPCVATDIVGLNKGPDGKIYGSTIISMHLFCFDPETRELRDLGRVGWGNGEIYDVIAYQDRFYMGSYTGAYWAVYDPQQPWNPRPDTGGTAPDANPRCLGQLGADMNRPFEYAVGPDERIYIACRANYGLPGGGLARFDPRTGEKTVFRDSQQSVQCVAADDRFVYGGTSIRGGRGCVDVTTQARLFLFDPAQERRVYECVPVPEAIAVTSLAVTPATQLVYGATDTAHLFAFDREERQVVRTWTLRSRGTPLMGVPEAYGIIHLAAGSDGDLYGVTGTDLFKLDTSTDRLIYLDPPPIPDLCQIVEGSPGVFYLGARGHLLEYHLKDTLHYR
jgi:outer membrane protein assembly factor BamB